MSQTLFTYVSQNVFYNEFWLSKSDLTLNTERVKILKELLESAW